MLIATIPLSLPPPLADDELVDVNVIICRGEPKGRDVDVRLKRRRKAVGRLGLRPWDCKTDLITTTIELDQRSRPKHVR